MIENEDEDEHEDENVCRTCVNLHNCSTNVEDGSARARASRNRIAKLCLTEVHHGFEILVFIGVHLWFQIRLRVEQGHPTPAFSSQAVVRELLCGDAADAYFGGWLQLAAQLAGAGGGPSTPFGRRAR